MRILPAALTAALLCAGLTGASAAEVQCAKQGLMQKLLTEKYKETPVGVGTINQDRFMQLFVSADGTWTMLMTKTDGESCIVASGENWDSVPQLAQAEPAA
jgi:hypothetical protein